MAFALPAHLWIVQYSIQQTAGALHPNSTPAFSFASQVSAEQQVVTDDLQGWVRIN